MAGFLEWLMQFTPSDLVAVCGLVAVTVVSAGSIRWQSARARRDGLAERRREVHLRFWNQANSLLRLVQADRDNLQGSSPATAAGNEEIPSLLDGLRVICWEIEIVSPDIHDRCTMALTALELAALDVRELSTVRSTITRGGQTPGTGARLKKAIDEAASDLEAARTSLNQLRDALRRYEDPDRK
ncbi:hypothetical protein ACQEVI_05840 [Promicromonospora sp. CA-289599]|uniref:hypothetical protein n=1 Tax=Promicromonospora sp. CA-289599 TaxID=3240014 RepID=UPI003D8CEFFA